MEFVYSTGGREKYFKATNVGDCVTRAICNATGKDYLEVYNDLKELAKQERITKRHRKKSSIRNGTYNNTIHRYLENHLGWKWVPTVFVGKGCTIHLTENELPLGTLIIQVSKHLTCAKNRVLYDTYDCSRNGTRCVYGYYIKEGAN